MRIISAMIGFTLKARKVVKAMSQELKDKNQASSKQINWVHVIGYSISSILAYIAGSDLPVSGLLKTIAKIVSGLTGTGQ